jgi:hypothetical protein
MTTLTLHLTDDAVAYLEHSAHLHGVTLPALVRKAIAVYAAAVRDADRREPRKLPHDHE